VKPYARDLRKTAIRRQKVGGMRTGMEKRIDFVGIGMKTKLKEICEPRNVIKT
jgi:hypothetical protein